MHVLTHIEGQDILVLDDGKIRYKGCGRIDSDGKGDHHGDLTADNHTSYTPTLDSDVDIYIVVPIEVILWLKPVILGSQAYVSYKDKFTPAVVGDVGNRTHPPTTRLGEISRACALALGINADPNRGGIDTPDLLFMIEPGVPAIVNGKQYNLCPYGV